MKNSFESDFDKQFKRTGRIVGFMFYMVAAIWLLIVGFGIWGVTSVIGAVREHGGVKPAISVLWCGTPACISE